MSDATQPDAIEPLLNATIGAPRLSAAQRQRHLARLSLTPSGAPSEAMRPALAGTILDDGSMRPTAYREHSWRSRRGLAELTLVAAVAVLLVVGVVVVQERSRNGGGEQRGIPVEQIMLAEEWPEPGEGLHVIVEFQTEYPYDNSTRRSWRVEQWQRVLADGTDQERRVMYDTDGQQLIALTINGNDWSWIIGDWIEAGTRDVGITGPPQQLSVTIGEPGMTARYLGALEDNPAELDGVEVERFRDERGDIIRIRNQDNPRTQYEDENRLFGVTVTGSYYEIVQDTENGNVLQSGGYLATEEGVEITLAQWTFIVVEAVPAAEMDAALFEVLSEPEFPHYDAPDQLPLSFALESHIDDSLVASERLEYASNGMEIVVNVQPTRGDYDSRMFIATRSDPSVVHTIESAAGPVTWMGSSLNGRPLVAYWDDGRYRFDLSVLGEAPDGWSEAELIAVVEALSSREEDSAAEPPDETESVGVSSDLIMAIAEDLVPGEGLHAIVAIETDYREDNSLRSAWNVESWRRVLPDGTTQEHFVMRDLSGDVFLTYTIDGDDWALNEGGWIESGTFGEGFSTISPQLSWSMSEPASAARFLDEHASSDQVEISQDERGDVYRMRSADDESFESERQQFGLAINGFVYEMVRDSETGNVLETRAFLTSEEGIEVTFSRSTIIAVEMLPADQIDDTLFELADDDEFPRFAAPEQLPGGLTLESHIDDFLFGSERLVYVGDGVELIVNVHPSRGGYDPSNLIATSRADAVIETVESVAGPVTLVASEAGVPPAGAYWDDGRYYFQLSVVGEAPDGWEEAALIAVVEALSNDAADT